MGDAASQWEHTPASLPEWADPSWTESCGSDAENSFVQGDVWQMWEPLPSRPEQTDHFMGGEARRAHARGTRRSQHGGAEVFDFRGDVEAGRARELLYKSEEDLDTP